MGLAGEDELHRAARVSLSILYDSVHVAHEQVGPFVGGEAAGKTDREHIRVEQVAGELLRDRFRTLSPRRRHCRPTRRRTKTSAGS